MEICLNLPVSTLQFFKLVGLGLYIWCIENDYSNAWNYALFSQNISSQRKMILICQRFAVWLCYTVVYKTFFQLGICWDNFHNFPPGWPKCYRAWDECWDEIRLYGGKKGLFPFLLPNTESNSPSYYCYQTSLVYIKLFFLNYPRCFG